MHPLSLSPARLRQVIAASAILLAAAATQASAQTAPRNWWGHWACHMNSRQTLTPDRERWTVTDEDQSLEIDVDETWEPSGTSWGVTKGGLKYGVTNLTAPGKAVDRLDLTVQDRRYSFMVGACKRN